MESGCSNSKIGHIEDRPTRFDRGSMVQNVAREIPIVLRRMSERGKSLPHASNVAGRELRGEARVGSHLSPERTSEVVEGRETPAREPFCYVPGDQPRVSV